MNKKGVSVFLASVFAGIMTLSGQEDNSQFGAGGMMIGTVPAKIVELDGGMVTNAPVTILMPLKQTDIVVEMIAGVVSADVRQLFFNDSNEHIEADYVFPLPDDATISEMIITINEERVVRSVVKERSEARNTYEEAKKAGKRTALLNRNTGNMMNMKIANLAPGDSAEVHLVYFQQTAFDNGTYRLTVPTVVAKQYVPPSVWEEADSLDPARLEGIVANESAPRLPPGVASDHHFSFQAVFSGMETDGITSPSHKIKVGRGDDPSESIITLADAVSYPDRDIVVDIRVREPERFQSSFLSSEVNGRFYTTASVVPAFDVPPVEDQSGRNVIFVVDTSGSMDGLPLQQAKEGVARALDYLRKSDRFSIYEFNSEFTQLVADAPVVPSAIDAARQAVAALQSKGGTEFLPVLKHILAGRMSADSRIIIFLTDGQSCQEDEVLRLVMADKTGAKIFPVSIGSAPNMALLSKMAEVGRGTVTGINDQKGIAQAVEMLFAKIQKPVMTDIAMRLIDSTGAVVDAEVYPTVFPDLFAGLPVKCSFSHAQLAGVTLVMSGVCNGEKQEIVCPLPANIIESDAVAQMFGQALINDLESRMMIAGDEGERNMIKDAILQAALDFQLVCGYTSRVAVEELIERLPDNTLRYVPVPLHTPKGALEGTATDDIARLLAGGGLLLAAVFLLKMAADMRKI